MILQNKIDFAVIFTVEKCNPNGDPLMGNRPRIDIDGYGEISDVCIKRKIRNRMQDSGQKIFVQSDDRSGDSFTSLKDRADGCEELKKEIAKKKKADKDLCAKIACREWVDVRSFGQVFAFKGEDVSMNVRGPVSITFAKSIEPIMTSEIMITRSTNTTTVPGNIKDNTTIGRKYIVEKGAYIFYGSIFPQLAELTGFSEEDAELLKQSLITLFENDASASRPSGSMCVNQVFWWKHKGKCSQYPAGKVFRSLKVIPDLQYPYYKIELNPLQGLDFEIYE